MGGLGVAAPISRAYIYGRMEKVSLADIPVTLKRAKELLDLNIQRLDETMHAGLADKGGFNAKHMDAVYKLGQVAAALGREARQWETKMREQVNNMPLAEKVKTIAGFIANLGKGDRLGLYEFLRDAEKKRPDGIKLVVG